MHPEPMTPAVERAVLHATDTTDVCKKSRHTSAQGAQLDFVRTCYAE